MSKPAKCLLIIFIIILCFSMSLFSNKVYANSISNALITITNIFDSNKQYVLNADGGYVFTCPEEYIVSKTDAQSFIYKADKDDISFYATSPIHLNNISANEFAEHAAQTAYEREYRNIIGYPKIVKRQYGDKDITGIKYYISHNNDTYCAETVFIPRTDNGWYMCWTVFYQGNDYKFYNDCLNSIESFIDG